MSDTAMIFGRSLMITILIQGASNLKEKRQVLRSIITKIRQKFNVSVVEAGCQAQWQRAQLGVAFIAGEFHLLDSIQQEIVKFIENDYPVEISEISQYDF